MLTALNSHKLVSIFIILTVITSSSCGNDNSLRNGAFCGNNHIQGTEECDDGKNNSNSNECTVACKIAVCGDGLVLEGKEFCDNGDLNSNISQNACRIMTYTELHGPLYPPSFEP